MLQLLTYTCDGLPLINHNHGEPYAYFLDYQGEPVYKWAGADTYNVTGN